jgi:hypothetical protein
MFYLRAANIINHRVVPRYQNTGEVVGFCGFEFASPYVGGLGGSAPLLVRFLGASEKMNKQPSLLLSSKKDVAITDIDSLAYSPLQVPTTL